MVEAKNDKVARRRPTPADFIDANIRNKYEGGKVDVYFGKPYLYNESRMDGKRVLREVKGLTRVAASWVDQYRVGDNGVLRIPEIELQKYIARKSGLKRPARDAAGTSLETLEEEMALEMVNDGSGSVSGDKAFLDMVSEDGVNIGPLPTLDAAKPVDAGAKKKKGKK